jgi:uncharacterized metal-binding protein
MTIMDFLKPVDCGCGCSSGPRLIFSCSGAADVGELTDRAARMLTREGNGKMACLAGIGGRVSGIVKSAEGSAAILAIDGCALACAKKSLEEAGLAKFTHLCLTDIDFKKGDTEVNETSVGKVVRHAKTIF